MKKVMLSVFCAAFVAVAVSGCCPGNICGKDSKACAAKKACGADCSKPCCANK